MSTWFTNESGQKVRNLVNKIINESTIAFETSLAVDIVLRMAVL